MSIRLYRDIARRKSRKIRVGIVEVGGDAHITVQSMTNTLTTDIQAAIRQLKGLEAASADIVRISCPNEDSTLALKSIVSAVAACLRINPGNIGSAARGGGQRANLIFC